MKKVGRDKFITKSRKVRKFSYKDVKYDEDGWADASKYQPIDFDLVFMKTTEGKVKSGWIATNVWEGIRLRPEEKVIKWKQYHEVRENLPDRS